MTILTAFFALPRRTRDVLLIAASVSVLAAFAASAEESAKPDPIESALAQEWQGMQLGQQHVADSLGKLLEAYRKEKARADVAEAKLKAQTEPVAK